MSKTQVVPARKTAKLKSKRGRKPKGSHTHIVSAGLAANGAPSPIGVRLLTKKEVCAITNTTFATVWMWMRLGEFPRSRIVKGRSMWLSSEVEAWINSLPTRRLKGDPPPPDQITTIKEAEPA